MKKGVYNYRTRNFDGSYNLFQVPVEVVGRTARRLRIRLLRAIDGHQCGHIMTVCSHNVVLQPSPAAEAAAYDYSGAWWND